MPGEGNGKLQALVPWAAAMVCGKLGSVGLATKRGRKAGESVVILSRSRCSLSV